MTHEVLEASEVMLTESVIHLPMGILHDETIIQMVLTVFGAGLFTGGMIFFLSFGISSALKIFKNV